MKKINFFNILNDIKLILIIFSIVYIIINFSSLYNHITWIIYANNEVEWQTLSELQNELENNNENLTDNELNKTFILYDNSNSIKNSKENNIYLWKDAISNINISLDELILIKKDNNIAIEKKLEEKRKDIIKDTKLTNSNTKNDDFFSLSTELTNEENKKYWDNAYIVIPKINVEAPIAFPSIEEKDLEKHILKLLENWVAHRPETQLPFQKWNFFILWHSSNYAWVNSKFNNIFAKIDLLNLNDEVYVYYKWRKYTYWLKEKKVVNPDAIEVYGYMPWYNLSLMTCWPIWSVKQRMIWIFELKKNN